jgi:AIPR protein
MSDNNLVLLEQFFQEWKLSAPVGLSDDKYSELFGSEQILKNYQLSIDELLAGCVGGSGDGGLDAFFTFVNNTLLDEDSDLTDVKREPVLTVYLGQVKDTGSFQEVVFDKASSTLSQLLNLTVAEKDLRKLYSARLVDQAMLFRENLQEIAGKHPKVEFRFAYATKGDASHVDAKVAIKGDILAKELEAQFPGASVSIEYYGATELLELARTYPTYTLALQFNEGPLSEGDSYIVLAQLDQYFALITDEKGNLRSYVFEWNVRDYQGDVEVNRDIRETLGDANSPPFWWLNNGITIIASKASITSKVISLDDVQIVNGLQTSIEIHNFLKDDPKKGANRLLLCRAIVTTDSSVRDQIIKATNFQTAVSAASLRATDAIQRDIEEFFLGNTLYYDRRKNYYRNIGKPADKIISISYLAQSVMALGLGQPNSSRARPTSLIKNDTDYARVFDPKTDLRVYLWAAKTMKAVEAFLRTEQAPGTPAEKREFRFHLAMFLACRAKGSRLTEVDDLIGLIGAEFSSDDMTAAMARLMELLGEYPQSDPSALSQIAKSGEFVRYIYKAEFNIET